MRKRAILLLAVALLVSLIFLVWSARQPSAPNVSITLIGYTNDSAGLRLAQFGVTNLNWDTAEVYLPFIVTQQFAPGSYSGYGPLPGYTYSATLKGDAGQVFIAPVPTNTARWKYQLNCYPTVGAARVIRGIGAMMFILFRMNPPYRTMPYQIVSDWVTNSTVVVTNAGAASTK